MNRIASIDLLRGLVMVLMTLDHVSHYFSKPVPYSTTDPVQATPAIFFTRWITHFCAPTFVLLAGVGAALTARRMTRPQLARFLLVRGLWLVLLELTLVRFGFYFSFDYHELLGLVIWALGWSMVLLAGLQFLPRPLLLAFALAMILGHNALESITPADFGRFGWLWKILHWRDYTNSFHDVIPLGGDYILFTPYKIIPWVGVMALGFCLGPIFQADRQWRRDLLYTLGFFSIAAFIALRFYNGYGDPFPWRHHLRPLQSFLSFLNCEKYPPSLCFLLLTLGPAFVLLALFDREPGWLGRRIVVFGRVPLFFYLIHLPLIHGLAMLLAWVTGDPHADWMTERPGKATPPPDYGYSLHWVYAVWLITLVLLYPLCAGFAEYKRRHPGGWRSYF